MKEEMNGWRSCLTAAEKAKLSVIEDMIANHKHFIKMRQEQRKAIVNRAIQRNTRHQKKGVDTEQVST